MALPTIPPINAGTLKWVSSMMHTTFMRVCAGGPTHVMYGLIVPNDTVLSVLDLMEISLTKKLGEVVLVGIHAFHNDGLARQRTPRLPYLDTDGHTWTSDGP